MWTAKGTHAGAGTPAAVAKLLSRRRPERIVTLWCGGFGWRSGLTVLKSRNVGRGVLQQSGTDTMRDVKWESTENATEWFGPGDDRAGQPSQIERQAAAVVGEFVLTVYETDRTPQGEPRHAWFNIDGHNTQMVQMLNDEGRDLTLSSFEDAKIAAVEIAKALVKAGCRPVEEQRGSPTHCRGR